MVDGLMNKIIIKSDLRATEVPDGTNLELQLGKMFALGT